MTTLSGAALQLIRLLVISSVVALILDSSLEAQVGGYNIRENLSMENLASTATFESEMESAAASGSHHEMDTSEQHNQVLIISVASILLSLCFTTFGLRLWARRMVKVQLGPDDWSMVAVLAVCTAMSVADLVGVRFGYGEHAFNLPVEDLYRFQINLYVFMLLWTAGTTLVRISILLLYWRIFTVPAFRKALIAAGAVVSCAGIALISVFAFQCSPPELFWDPRTGGTCIQQLPFYLSGGSINLLEDLMVLVLPMPVLWRLKATVSKKLALSLIFALGGFVCITSVIRIFAIKEIDPTDFTWSNVGGGVWSTIEVEVGCICANLVHLRPIAGMCFKGLRTRTQSTNDVSMEGRWSKRRSERLEASTDSSSRRTRGSGWSSGELQLDGKPNEGIVVQTELSQDVQSYPVQRTEAEMGQFTTKAYGLG